MTKKANNTGQVFQRQETGLVKNVSFLDAIAVSISYMSIGAALALIGFTMAALPTVSSVNLVYGSIIAAVLTIPQIVYTMMTRCMPRTGRGLCVALKVLGGFVGSTITFMYITIETMPYLALIALSAVFAIGSVGLSLGYNCALLLARQTLSSSQCSSSSCRGLARPSFSSLSHSMTGPTLIILR